MAQIKINAWKLSLAEKLAMAELVISKGTNNPNVPDNLPLLQDLGSKNSALKAAGEAAASLRLASKQATKQTKALEKDWMGSMNSLASFTASAVKGDAMMIEGAGFEVKNPPAPAQPMGQVTDLNVALNHMPGYSTLTWTPLDKADHYVIETSPDPITDSSWSFVTTTVSASFYGNGATAGQKRWYRVAGVNVMGQGPWSAPGLRPVM